LPKTRLPFSPAHQIPLPEIRLPYSPPPEIPLARDSLALPQGIWRRLLAVASARSRLIPSASGVLVDLIESGLSCLKEV
jgi:hypothetical protein